jgi:hypothetical protein
MSQADSAHTTSLSRLPPAARAVLAAGLPEIPTDLPFPTRPLPLAQPFHGGFMPVIYHPERTTEWLRFERFPRKTKATGVEAFAYAARVIWWRQRREADKRRRIEAIDPRAIAAVEGRAA